MPEYEELIKEISMAEYNHRFCDGTHSRMTVGDDDALVTAIAKTIYTWASKQEVYNDLVKRIAELEARVYAYEQIIAKSNFEPMLLERIKPLNVKMLVGGEEI